MTNTNIIFGHSEEKINEIFETITNKINDNYKLKNYYNFNDYYYNYEEEIGVVNNLIIKNVNICIFVTVIKSSLNKYLNINRGRCTFLEDYIKINTQLEYLCAEFGKLNYYYCKNNFDELDKCVTNICVRLLLKKNIKHIQYIYNFLYLSI